MTIVHKHTSINGPKETVTVRRHTDFSTNDGTEFFQVEVPARKGRYMHTSNGRKYYPLDPRPDEVDPQVVAHHLATRCRYNGATQHPIFRTKIFYSVAEHSVYVSLYLEKELGLPQYALEGLFHDGSEAYNGDLIRPLKYDELFRAPFKIVEDLNEHAGAEALNLIYPYPKEIKIADEAVTAAEVIQIVPKDPTEEWGSGKLHDDTRVAPYEIKMMDPWEAKNFFLDRYEEVIAKRSKYRELPKRFTL
ncbi:hypothetical protein [Phyllobacterium myrsinacearum]|uniref:Phosphohydrolase n=1 Tax=Phyllobacterium myrsinacearum TaxID=28101 RepID=A0A839ENG8_9HYPH|nr:hypothetical protein [Phyllobacterium myrsinacearum]MBA8881631.1 hypothetical protein [Phyllobacterium myrsinacearum]